MKKWLERWLGCAAARTLARERPIVIAVTGSVGKSTTKQMIAAAVTAVRDQKTVRVSQKNYNNELGLPLAIFGLNAPGRSPFVWIKTLSRAFFISHGWKGTGAQTFILEMGADKPGDLMQLSSIAPPDIAVITAVTPDDPSLVPVHTANYASIEAVAEEKSTLVKTLPEDGAAILNADDKRVFAMRHLTGAHVVTFGEADGADVQLSEARIVTERGPAGTVPVGLQVTFQSLNRLRRLFFPGVFGRSVAYAVCAAASVAAALDLGFESVERLPERFIPLPGRTRIIPGIKQTTLFDDTYNASPAAVLSAMHDLASMPLDPHQRRIACIGEMRELGEQSAAMHRLIGAEAAKVGIDLLVSCGTFAHAMEEGALANGMDESRVKIFEDTPEAGRFLQDWIRPGDVILAKASQGDRDSKGVRMERVIRELMAEPVRAGELLVRQEEAWKGRR